MFCVTVQVLFSLDFALLVCYICPFGMFFPFRTKLNYLFLLLSVYYSLLTYTIQTCIVQVNTNLWIAIFFCLFSAYAALKKMHNQVVFQVKCAVTMKTTKNLIENNSKSHWFCVSVVSLNFNSNWQVSKSFFNRFFSFIVRLLITFHKEKQYHNISFNSNYFKLLSCDE